MKKKLTLLCCVLAIVSCAKEPETIIEYQTVEKIVETPGETVTVVETVETVLPPDAYSFTRGGVSTVYYSGQTARVKMASEIYSALKTETYTQTQIDAMFSLGTGFTDTTLDTSGKTVRSKTASYGGSATVKSLFDGWITEATSVVFPVWNTNGSKGVAGQVTDPGTGGRSVRVNAKGMEINQIFTKGLIGAMALDQIVNGYLDKTEKLDAAQAGNDAGDFAYTSPGATEANVTKMEHYWDEGFGYLYGQDNQAFPALGKGVLLNKYLKKVESNEPGISKNIYNAFALGRAAIVAKNYTLRDEQAAIIKSELSKVIGYKAAFYLRGGGKNITEGKMADAFHALSEGYGFILSLQFTKDANGAAYFTNAEVNAFLERLSAGDGFWDRTEDELKAMATEIDAKTGLPATN